MKNYKLVLVMFVFTLLFASLNSTRATVLTFEDLSGTGVMPDPYHGIIDWENGVWNYYNWYQYPYSPHSGIVRTYESGYDHTPSWGFLQDVIYNGSYFAGVGDVQMDLYLDGNLVHSTGISYTTSTSTFFATGYSGLVDYVTINTAQPDMWVMDDLTYQSAPPQVPEPTTMILLGSLASGLFGFAGLRKRFTK